ncbi:hypothetical protein MIDIC_330028 [Alphaproteobacteria bacterium]
MQQDFGCNSPYVGRCIFGISRKLVVFAVVAIIGGVINVGCSCQTSYLPEMSIANPQDQYLTCQQIVYAISESKFWLKNVNERCARPQIFAKYPPCIPAVKLDAARNEYVLKDRIGYLNTLYGLKGCSENPSGAADKTSLSAGGDKAENGSMTKVEMPVNDKR